MQQPGWHPSDERSPAESGLLNAWCGLSTRNMSGRCLRTKVGLPPDPEGKGTELLCSMWTPSSLHSTSSSTTSATPGRRKGGSAPGHPSPTLRSLPWSSSLGGAASAASATSSATLDGACTRPSPPCPIARSSTGWCARGWVSSRRSPCTWRSCRIPKTPPATKLWTPRPCRFATRSAEAREDGSPATPSSGGPTAWGGTKALACSSPSIRRGGYRLGLRLRFHQGPAVGRNLLRPAGSSGS